jgi:hypothetical protein
MSFQFWVSAEGKTTFITSGSGFVACYGAGVDIFLTSGISFEMLPMLIVLELLNFIRSL